MSSAGGRPAALPARLVRLRRRLTAWYAATFFVILVLLGVGMFAAITRRFDEELDASLTGDAKKLAEVASNRGAAAAIASAWIPGRTLIITDSAGRLVAGDSAPEWVGALARSAWNARRPVGDSHAASEDQLLRAMAQPVRADDARRAFVAVAIGDEVELEDRYTSLIVLFSISALLAVLLVALGGWIVAGQAIAPIGTAFEHMRRFMADAAHELRTPITVTRSRAEVALQRPRSGEEYVGALTSIEREARRLGSIVDDLLTLARADAGERPIASERFFLDDVALDAAQTARALAERRSVRLDVEDFEEAPVTGDAALVNQLVLILLDNAIKYTEPGGDVRVSVRSTATTISLIVSDTGIGITSEQLPHVFERFYRGDPSRVRNASGALSEGAGLGLSIAQWIADAHHAVIQVASTPGTGSVFTVEFPREA